MQLSIISDSYISWLICCLFILGVGGLRARGEELLAYFLSKFQHTMVLKCVKVGRSEEIRLVNIYQ